jgi:hypothetical protein
MSATNIAIEELLSPYADAVYSGGKSFVEHNCSPSWWGSRSSSTGCGAAPVAAGTSITEKNCTAGSTPNDNFGRRKQAPPSRRMSLKRLSMSSTLILEPTLEHKVNVEVEIKTKLDVREFLVKLARSASANKTGDEQDSGSVLKMVSSLPAEDIKAAMLSLIEPLPRKRASISVAEDVSGVDEALSKSIDIFENPAVKTPAKVHHDWEIGLHEVKFLRRIGKGAAGTTYSGKWRGEPVALKVSQEKRRRL